MPFTRNDLFPKPVQLAAQHSERATGVPACVILAQWAHESGFGKYSMGLANNPFGIKWPGVKSGLGYVVMRTWEVIGGRRVDLDAKFAKFPSLAAAFAYHGRMLANPKGHYARALPLRGNWRAYVKSIAPIYATDPAYATRLIDLIEKWRLYELNLPKPASADAAARFPGY